MIEEDTIFIRHIQSHLLPGEEVVCKICGKSAKEIIAGVEGRRMKSGLVDKIGDVIRPGYMDKSLSQFVDSVAVLHREESMKASPDKRLLEVLEDSLRVVFELNERNQ